MTRRQPTAPAEAPTTKYLVQHGDTVTLYPARPTQAELKEQGEGTYNLLRTDASLVKVFHVSTNRNGNPKIEAEIPHDLTVIPSRNLVRVRTALQRAAKYWPAKNADIKRVQAELDAREQLLAAFQLPT